MLTFSRTAHTSRLFFGSPLLRRPAALWTRALRQRHCLPDHTTATQWPTGRGHTQHTYFRAGSAHVGTWAEKLTSGVGRGGISRDSGMRVRTVFRLELRNCLFRKLSISCFWTVLDYEFLKLQKVKLQVRRDDCIDTSPIHLATQKCHLWLVILISFL